jgi:hypothetical protein
VGEFVSGIAVSANRMVVCIRQFGSEFRSAAPDWQGATTENTGVFEGGATQPGGMPRPKVATEMTDTGH